jgi:hypothetical protein
MLMMGIELFTKTWTDMANSLRRFVFCVAEGIIWCCVHISAQRRELLNFSDFIERWMIFVVSDHEYIVNVAEEAMVIVGYGTGYSLPELLRCYYR